jgi:hypothetical protein
MLHKFRFVIAGVLIILVNQVVTFAVSASMPSALLPAGTTRYAAAHNNTAYGIDETGDWQDLVGMTKYITIPAGKTADVFVSFCTQLNKVTGSYVHVRGLIRSAVSLPAVQVMELTTQATVHCANFYWTNVAAGQPAIKMQVYVPLATSAQVHNATMFITVNVH